MLYRIAAVAALLAGLVSPSAGEGFFPFPYQQQKLANGLTLITIPTPSPGLVAYFTVVRTGSRDEVEAGRSGYAHFFEHMMFRGTKRFPGSAYDAIVTELGGAGQRPDQRRPDDVPSHLRQGGPRAGDRHRERPVPAPQLRRAGLPDRGRRGLRRIPHQRDRSLERVGREAAGLGLRRASLQAHGDRLRARHQGDARGLRVQQGFSSAFLSPGERGDPGRRRRRSAGDVPIDREILRPVAARLPAAEDADRAAADRAALGARHLPRPDAADPDAGLQGRRLRHGKPRLRGRPAAGRIGLRPARAICTRSWCSAGRRSSRSAARCP